MDADGGGSGIPFSEGVPGENCLSWSVPFYDWFKDLLFSALLGEMIQFDEYFWDGWFNHQLDDVSFFLQLNAFQTFPDFSLATDFRKKVSLHTFGSSNMWCIYS